MPARHRIASILLSILLLAPRCALGQEGSGDENEWRPSAHSFSLGFQHFTEDGESGGRLGFRWHPLRRLSLGASWRSWSDYEVLEPEVRGFFLTDRIVSPFLGVSMIRQRHFDKKGSGFGVAAGIEVFGKVGSLGGSVSVGLGWRSLYRERERDFMDPLAAGGDPTDKHWFRLRSGIRLFPR